MDDTLTHNLKLAAEYGVPVPPYPMPKTWEVFGCDVLNVRSGAGITYRIVGELMRTAKVYVIREVNGWAEIAPGQWCSKVYLRRVE